MSNCNHNCESCNADCGDRKTKTEDFSAPLNAFSTVKKVIGVVSGKGGVGKSSVACLLALAASKKGFKTAILDADITGPSIAQAFGLKQKLGGNEMGIVPAVTNDGIKVVSVNLLLENESDPVVWRGPVLAGAVKQFWSEVCWGEVDYMFVDMPPGTGDIPLTVFQSLPVDGIVIVTTPQQLVEMIVEKAVKMARLMNIPVLGLVENMSYIECPDCGKQIELFGKSRLSETAKRFGISATAKMPIDPKLTALCDEGRVEEYDSETISQLETLIKSVK